MSSDRVELLSLWAQKSSPSERDRQERAERMIGEAIARHPAFRGVQIAVYAKGSYRNETNVRLDSDVDVVVENRELAYFEYMGESPAVVNPSPYAGPWTPEVWRDEVHAALRNHFPVGDVAAGNTAILVKERPGSRPSADVVPSFQFIQYYRPDRSLKEIGTKVFRKSGADVVNWPQQQLVNGGRKDTATRGRYKAFVRILKRAENQLVEDGLVKAKPSYLMECLIWNVPNEVLLMSRIDDAFCETLRWLWHQLGDGYKREDWLEPNQIKYLFHVNQKWTREDAQEVVLKTWKLLEY